MKSKERNKSILEYVQCMYNNVVTPLSAHFISDHCISYQKVRTVMVRAIVRVRVRVMVRVWVRVRVRLGGAVVRIPVGRKVGNPIMYTHIRSQASDWNCCVKRFFVCAQQSTSLIVHIMIRRIPHK